MENENVYSWNQALENKCEPRGYPYKDAIIGTFNAVLDFKIWGKESAAVICYFRDLESGTKFQISVFRQKDETYKIKGGVIDFTTCPIGKEYKLSVEKNTKGNPFLKACTLMSDQG